MKIAAYKDRFHITYSANYKDCTTNFWGWSKKQEGTGKWGKQHTEKHCQLNYSDQRKWMTWAVQAGPIIKIINAHQTCENPRWQNKNFQEVYIDMIYTYWP